MKKILPYIIVMIIFMTSGIKVQASDDNNNIDEENVIEFSIKAGIKPTNPIYFLDKSIEDFQLWITRSETKKAKLLLSFAEERLSELDSLNEEDADEYVDQLYEEYGLKLEKVNEILTTLMIEEEISEEKYNILIEKLNHTADVEEVVNTKNAENLSLEIKDKISDSQTKAYSISIVTDVQLTTIEDLKSSGFGYGEIIKLQALAVVSDMTIDELMYLDIFNKLEEDKEVDFGKLAQVLEVNRDDVKEQFKTYKNAIKDEKQNKKDEIKEQINQRLGKVVTTQKQQLLSKIDDLYNIRLDMINNSSLSTERKDELINELDEVKSDLITRIEEKVESGNLNPRDIGEINREIMEEFDELIDNLSLRDDEKDELNNTINDIDNIIRPIVVRIVEEFEEKYQITVSDRQLNEIIEEVSDDAENNRKKGRGQEYLREIQNEVLDELEEMFEDDLNLNGQYNNNTSNEGNRRGTSSSNFSKKKGKS